MASASQPKCCKTGEEAAHTWTLSHLIRCRWLKQQGKWHSDHSRMNTWLDLTCIIWISHVLEVMGTTLWCAWRTLKLKLLRSPWSTKCKVVQIRILYVGYLFSGSCWNWHLPNKLHTRTPQVLQCHKLSLIHSFPSHQVGKIKVLGMKNIRMVRLQWPFFS